MTEQKTLAEVINEKIDYAIEAMEYAYKNKVFVVWTGTRIENFFKTKKSAETYLSKQESVSYYDDYTKDMRNCGSGLSVDFVNVSELVDIKTDKQIWYKEIRRKMAYSHMVKNVIENAKYNEVSEETLIFIEDLVNDYLETGGLKIPDFSEKEIQKTV